MLSRFVVLFAAVISVLLFNPIIGGTAPEDDDPFQVLTGGRLVDGTGAEPVDDAAVVIRHGRILYAGPRTAVELPTGADIIDVSGLVILPGFVNAHVHGSLDTRTLTAWAQAGVTTVRDLGADAQRLAAFRAAHPPLPAQALLVAAGPLITVPGGYPIVPFGGGPTAIVTSRVSARQTGEALLDGGVDLLKLALETGTGFGRAIPTLSLADAQTLVRVAHGRGTVVSVHITSTVDLGLALDAGVDDLAHMAVDRALTAAEVQRVVDQGVTWVPTLELWACTGPRSMAISNLHRFAAAGGRVALGTDYAGYTCDWELGMPMTEIRLMAQAGMTPMQIIVSATREGARVSNLERELGTLEKGKRADLFVVEGDPLTDVENLTDVRMVMRGGVVIRDELPTTSLLRPRRGGRRVGR